MIAHLESLRKSLIERLQKKLCGKSNNAKDVCRNAYPENFLRGFNMKDCFTQENNVAPGAFQFGDFRSNRKDDFLESSINWEDDEDAVDFLLNQKKDGSDEQMFKYGYARLPLNMVKMTLKSLIQKNYLDFERKPLKNNPYHGNILIPASINKPEKLMIQNNLAALANNDFHSINPEV